MDHIVRSGIAPSSSRESAAAHSEALTHNPWRKVRSRSAPASRVTAAALVAARGDVSGAKTRPPAQSQRPAARHKTPPRLIYVAVGGRVIALTEARAISQPRPEGGACPKGAPPVSPEHHEHPNDQTKTDRGIDADPGPVSPGSEPQMLTPRKGGY